jgi:anti-sigma factor RsiW
MIDCEVVQQKLGRFLDRELPLEESAVLHAHIEGCSRCQQELKALQDLSAFLDAVPLPPVPAGTVDGILAHVRQEVKPRKSWGALGFWKPWPIAMRFAAAGTAIAACLIGLMLGSATSFPANRARGDMAWVGLASGGSITSAYMGAPR